LPSDACAGFPKKESINWSSLGSTREALRQLPRTISRRLDWPIHPAKRHQVTLGCAPMRRQAQPPPHRRSRSPGAAPPSWPSQGAYPAAARLSSSAGTFTFRPESNGFVHALNHRRYFWREPLPPSALKLYGRRRDYCRNRWVTTGHTGTADAANLPISSCGTNGSARADA
jgi:hypothetical protein